MSRFTVPHHRLQHIFADADLEKVISSKQIKELNSLLMFQGASNYNTNLSYYIRAAQKLACNSEILNVEQIKLLRPLISSALKTVKKYHGPLCKIDNDLHAALKFYPSCNADKDIPYPAKEEE